MYLFSGLPIIGVTVRLSLCGLSEMISTPVLSSFRYRFTSNWGWVGAFMFIISASYSLCTFHAELYLETTDDLAFMRGDLSFVQIISRVSIDNWTNRDEFALSLPGQWFLVCIGHVPADKIN